MRSFIILALVSRLVALASAITPATDYVMIVNPADYSKGVVYTNEKSGACKNVDKLFNKHDTTIATKGRAVELYSGLNCTKNHNCARYRHESVAQILKLKKDLGLFKHPFADSALANTVGSAQDIQAARNAVRKSVTLLENANNVLPLRQSGWVLFFGPMLNYTRYMGGGWNMHWQGPSDAEGDAVYQGFGGTVIKGVQQVTGSVPLCIPGVDIDGTAVIEIDAVIAAAKHANKIVIDLSKKCYAGNVGNIDSLVLPWQPLNLAYTVAQATDKPIVVVLVEGHPRRPDRVPDVTSAIINAYLPGAYGGLSVAEILCRVVNSLGPKLDALVPLNPDYSHTIFGFIDDQTKVYSPELTDAARLQLVNALAQALYMVLFILCHFLLWRLLLYFK
ncbi:hypothetical protein GGI21_001593 [Coemansia aciculifera]|nr:hypothetical protein GGI21_001593 [Coemansia aciculifera]